MIVYKLFLTLTVTSYIVILVNSLNILGVLPYQGRSHFLGCEKIFKELAKKGHNVTVISYFPQKRPLANYHDISLAGKTEIYESWVPVQNPSYYLILAVSYFLVKTGSDNCKTMLSDENVQNLWKSKRKFDVVVVEQFNSDCSLGLAHILGAPVVGITSGSLMPYHFRRFGVPQNPSFTPFQLLSGGTKPTFYERVERTIFTLYFHYVVKIVSQYLDQCTINEYFDDVPPLEDLGRNIKFLLLYEHSILSSTTILPSNVIQVGGYHVDEIKPLPTNLQKFINESQHGVVYISFGTMLKSSLIQPEKLKAIIDAVAELPQRVIWKWDNDSLPNMPNNILISKWLPQNDLLAHPKILAMFSHCGQLGLTEAVSHGVPIIGMPVFGDQPLNAAAIEESGFGVQIMFNDLTKETLLEKFNIVLDPKFRKKTKLLSKMWRDRPVSAKENAVFWIEYAARYPNHTFRSAAADVPYYQYFCLDILFCFFIILLVIYFVIHFVIRLVVYIVKRNKGEVRQSRSKRKKL